MKKRKHGFDTLRYKICLQNINTKIKEKKKLMTEYIDFFEKNKNNPKYCCFFQYSFITDRKVFLRGYYETLKLFTTLIESKIQKADNKTYEDYKNAIIVIQQHYTKFVLDNNKYLLYMNNRDIPINNEDVGIYAAAAVILDIITIENVTKEEKWNSIVFRDEEPIKVIFLDIDGVLNCIDDYKNDVKINDDKIKILQEIVEKSKAKIVLSSSWRFLSRKNKYRILLEEKLAEYGMSIYGETPPSKEKWINVGRPHEIKKWLEMHPEATHWVSLDDDYDEKDYEDMGIGKHTVHTHFYGAGLTHKHINMALEILEVKNEEDI